MPTGQGMMKKKREWRRGNERREKERWKKRGGRGENNEREKALQKRKKRGKGKT